MTRQEKIGFGLVTLLLASAFAFVAALTSKDKVEASSFLGSPDLMAISCPTNYQRVAPRICAITAPVANHTISIGAGCSTMTITSVSSTARMVNANVNFDIRTAAGLAVREIVLTIYFDSGCTSTMAQFQIMSREEVSLAAGNRLYQVRFPLMLPTNGQALYYTATTTGGAGTTADVTPIAFWDS